MSRLHIAPERGSYQPGETITGEVSWTLAAAPRAARLRLGWRLEGPGIANLGEAEEVGFEQPLADDRRAFSFVAPALPPSLRGRLFTVVWGLELTLDEGGSHREDLVIAPDGAEIDLQREDWLVAAEPPFAKGWGFFPAGRTPPNDS